MDDFFLNWSEFWSEDPPDHHWLYEPILAYGRSHAIYAKKKQGKSLVFLSLGAYLSQNQNNVVIYIDYEMTRADVWERLEDMGYGPHSDLSRLRYALLPSMMPLDTREGSDELMEIVDDTQRDFPGKHLIVMIDTYGRAVGGPEDKADTTRAFYRWTGIELKKRGITSARLDHEGKDGSREQRGSSAKGDDVDVVWKLSQKGNDILLKLDVARMSWVPDEVLLVRRNEPLTFDVKREALPAVIESLIMELDLLDVPSQATVRECRAVIQHAGYKASTDTLRDAVKHRKQRRYSGGTEVSDESGTGPGSDL